MPEGRFKSRSWRRIFVKAPGGRVVRRYERRKPSRARCSNCERILPGVARERPYKMRKMVKSARRPERPYGGNLCSRCMRELFKGRAKSEVKE